jgi:threonine dehydrogenase-like Zn-dependent dehydrogenase
LRSRGVAPTPPASQGTAAPTEFMRALVVDGRGVQLESKRPTPAPEAGEALIATSKVAVGGLDVQVSQGLLGFRGVLGHAFVGVVQSTSGAHGGLLGQRVAGSVDVVCGSCSMCVAGLSNHCRNRTVLGISGRDGCLANYFTLPLKNLTDVPDSVDDDRAVFAHLLASAIQAARQLTLEGKPYITVLGDGPLGLLMVQVMAKLNASVRLIGRFSERLALCEKWGIKHRHVDDIGRRADQDVVVDCTGSPTGLELALQLVRPRGKIVCKTMTAPGNKLVPGVDLTPLVINEIELIGSRFGPVSEAVTMIARGEVDVLSLIGKRMTLDAGPAIVEVASRPGALQILVDA